MLIAHKCKAKTATESEKMMARNDVKIFTIGTQRQIRKMEADKVALYHIQAAKQGLFWVPKPVQAFCQ
jgi:hypothetical protein